MNSNYLRYALLLPGIWFTIMGLQWAFAPASIAPQLGMELLTGMALSTQIGDIGALFMGIGTMTLLGFYMRNAAWLHPASLLLALIAEYRILAFTLHGADFALLAIIIEIIFAALLFYTARTFEREARSESELPR